MTVRTRLLGVLSVVCLVAMVALTIPFVTTSTILNDLQRTNASLLRASTAYANLSQALSDQETGIRGYLLTAQESYLAPYHEGAAREQQVYERLDAGADSVGPVRLAFDRVRDAATDWRATYARPTIDDMRAGRLDAARSSIRLQTGKDLFDQIRRRTAELGELMAAPDMVLDGQIAALQGLRTILYASTVAGILVALLIASTAIRRWVTVPLSQLVLTARRVEAGDDDATFQLRRRDELGDLAAALERMRGRMVAGQAEAEEVAGRSSVLNFFTELTAFTETDVDVAKAMLTAVRELVEPDHGAVHISNRSRDRALPEATIGRVGGEPLTLHKLESCPGIRRGTLYVVSDVTAPLAVRCPVALAETGTVACIPLSSMGETVGAAHLLWDAPDQLPMELRATLSRIAEHTALSIGNRRLVGALKRMADTDARTGLPNSRAFDEAAERLLPLSDGRQAAILMLDLDHFKDFNDRYGHPGGDEALRAFAGILRSCMRDGDLAARYGGEEFAVLLDGVDPATALEIGERIRSRAASAIVALGPGITARITCSVGIALAPIDGNDRVTLLRAADDALYRAKEGGRNRVATTSEVVPPASATA